MDKQSTGHRIYLFLSVRQQNLTLKMNKSFLNVDKDAKGTTHKQYNKEVNAAVKRIEKGNFVSHANAI